ncbi:MAG: hypothetical protein DBY24_10525 [Prevotellaceae bacterium]|nr:MAG: hypothetical protein DBY24_10525 [Prevotellaceae bacterium]
MPEFAIGQKDTNKSYLIPIKVRMLIFSTLSLLHPKLGSRSPCTKKARTLFSFPSALKQQAKGREDF